MGVAVWRDFSKHLCWGPCWESWERGGGFFKRLLQTSSYKSKIILGKGGGCFKRLLSKRFAKPMPKSICITILGKGAAVWKSFSKHLSRSPQQSWGKGGGCWKDFPQRDFLTKTQVPNMPWRGGGCLKDFSQWDFLTKTQAPNRPGRGGGCLRGFSQGGVSRSANKATSLSSWGRGLSSFQHISEEDTL